MALVALFASTFRATVVPSPTPFFFRPIYSHSLFALCALRSYLFGQCVHPALRIPVASVRAYFCLFFPLYGRVFLDIFFACKNILLGLVSSGTFCQFVRWCFSRDGCSSPAKCSTFFGQYVRLRFVGFERCGRVVLGCFGQYVCLALSALR